MSRSLYLHYMISLDWKTHVFIFQIDAEAPRVQEALTSMAALAEFVESLCSAHGLTPQIDQGLWRSEPRFELFPNPKDTSLLVNYRPANPGKEDSEKAYFHRRFQQRRDFALENPASCPMMQGPVGQVRSKKQMEALRLRLQQEVEQVVGKPLLGQSTAQAMNALEHILDQV